MDTIVIMRNSDKIAKGHPMRSSFSKASSEWDAHTIRVLLGLDRKANHQSESELFFSRWKRGLHKRLNSRMVNDLVQDTAREMGLDPKRFSTKSFKAGSVSSAEAATANRELTMQAGNHASAHSSGHYIQPAISKTGSVSFAVMGHGLRMKDTTLSQALRGGDKEDARKAKRAKC